MKSEIGPSSCGLPCVIAGTSVGCTVGTGVWCEIDDDVEGDVGCEVLCCWIGGCVACAVGAVALRADLAVKDMIMPAKSRSTMITRMSQSHLRGFFGG